MKKLSIMFASVAMLFGVGLGVSALDKGSKEAAPVEKVEAAVTSATIEIRFVRPTDWGNNMIRIHTWDEGGSGTTWPGNEMTYLWNNEYGQAVYSWVPSSQKPLYSNIIFNNNNNGMQTSTLPSPSSSKQYFYDGGWKNMDVPTMKLYLYDYDTQITNKAPKIHCWRENFADFDVWPGKAMTATSYSGNGIVYEVDISNATNRVIFNDGGSFQTATLTPTGGNYCFVMGSCVSASGEWWDNINYVHAHNFAQNILDFRGKGSEDTRDTGYCREGNHYSLAKSTYNAIKGDANVINELNNGWSGALDRLAAWARANGESFNPSNGLFSGSNSYLMFSKEESSAAAVAIAVTLISLAAVGGFFLIKRKKKLD